MSTVAVAELSRFLHGTWSGRRLAGLGAVIGLLLVAAPGARASSYTAFDAAKPLFETLREDLWPEAFQGKTLGEIEAQWPTWIRSHDADIRRRVTAGDDDSVLNLLLFGTSFTAAPRATVQDLAALASAPTTGLAAIRGRIDALVRAAASTDPNERLTLVRDVARRTGTDLASTDGRDRFRAYLEKQAVGLGREGAEQLATMVNEPDAIGTIFRSRGLSTDTLLTAGWGVERALMQMAESAQLERGSVRRVGIIGPGLDFIDKQMGYDFYPQQTIQPFAVIDALRRTTLAARSGVAVHAFDVSARVLQHIEQGRGRASKGAPYSLVLARGLERPSTPELASYFHRFGDAVGTPTKAPPVPANVGRAEVRAVSIRPDVVLTISAGDLNVVTQHAEANEGRADLDLIVATNVLLYYDVFEQSLALANIAAMLRPGGLLITNNRLIELPASPLTRAGYVDAVYTSVPGLGETGDRIYWYRKP